jgi:hypothetical protein
MLRSTCGVMSGMKNQRTNATKRTAKPSTGNARDTLLASAARTLIQTLGEETAAAMAAKLVVTYGRHPADLGSAKLGHAIVEAMGVERYNGINVL